MELPSTPGPRKSVTPGGQFDRKTLNKILNKSKNEDGHHDDSPESLPAFPATSASICDQVEGAKTKYQLEKDSEPLPNSSNLHQSLLDSSSVFRSRTAIPHGLLFDLHQEVYPIVQSLLDEYTKFSALCIGECLKRKDSDMDALVEDAKNALVLIGKYIGKDCDGLSPQEYTTNKIYADAKAGTLHPSLHNAPS